MQQVIQKELLSEEMLLKEPRSEEEKMRSSHLLKLLLVSTHTHTHTPGMEISTRHQPNAGKLASPTGHCGG